jgi:hypothetical protein
LNVLALAAKVNPEADVWPALRGVTSAVLTDSHGDLAGALILIHAVDNKAAERLETVVLPRLFAAWVKGGVPAGSAGTVRRIGHVSNRPVQVVSRGTTVIVGWGEGALASALSAKDHPELSAGKIIRSGWTSQPPQRAGAFWPGRVRVPASDGSPWPLALAGSSPVLWQGSTDATSSRDELRWSDLRGLVRRFLERLPYSPPPGS